MPLRPALVATAVSGMLLGATACGGGNQTPAADPATQGTTTDPGGKSSCSGAGHTDKGHCAAAPSASGAPLPPK